MKPQDQRGYHMQATQISLLNTSEIYDVYRVCILVKSLKPKWHDTPAIPAFYLAHTKQTKVVGRLFKDRFGQLFVGVQIQSLKVQTGMKDVLALYDANESLQDYLREYCASFVDVMNKRKDEFYAN